MSEYTYIRITKDTRRVLRALKLVKGETYAEELDRILEGVRKHE